MMNREFDPDSRERALHGMLLEQSCYLQGESDRLAAQIVGKVRSTRRRHGWVPYAWVIAAAACVTLIAWVGFARLHSAEAESADPPVIVRSHPAAGDSTLQPARKHQPQPGPVVVENPVVTVKPPPVKEDPVVVREPAAKEIPAQQLPVAVARVASEGLHLLRDQRTPLKRGASIFADDRIIADSSATVQFKDGSTLELTGGTRCVFWRPAEGDRADVEILRGRVRATVRTAASRFIVEMPAKVATLGGTFDATAGKSARVSVAEGSATMTSAGRTIQIPAGRTAEAARGGSPVLIPRTNPNIAKTPQQSPQRPPHRLPVGTPPAIATALRERYPDVEVTGIVHALAGKGRIYKVTGKRGRAGIVIRLNDDGSDYRKAGEAVAAGDLPAPVVQAIRRRYPKMVIAAVETERKKGALIYKIKGRVGKREREMKIQANGIVVKDEKKKEDDGDDDDDKKRRRDDDDDD